MINGGSCGEQRSKDRIETPNSGRGELYVSDNGDQQEVEQLRKQLEKIQGELSDAFQEAEVSKQRRDWAFGERDKVVLERESIRTLCDRLRRERDRAVSELAEALRETDDIKRQRNDASKELKGLNSLVYLSLLTYTNKLIIIFLCHFRIKRTIWRITARKRKRPPPTS